MLLILYDQYGNEKAELQANDSSTQDKEVQADNVLSLGFTLYQFVAIDVNDYVDYAGERYWAVERYNPAEKSSVEWEYDLKLYGIESLIKRFLVLNNTDGENEAVFTLTARPVEHVRLIVKCINDGMDGITDFKVGRVEGTDNVVINYEGKYCDEALKELSETVGVEWWFDGETVNLCRCEYGSPIGIGYNEGLTGLEQSKSDNVKFYTRLFPIGSSRNIDRDRYGASRLQLPGGAKYVDIPELAEKYGITHHYEQRAFSDIYPRRVGVVSNVRSEEVQSTDGNPYTIYYFKDNSLTFNPNDYEIGDQVKRVSFQEGSELAGLGTDDDHYFEVNYNSQTGEFEIVTIWPYDDDRQLPGGTLVPKPGDKYILWNISMPDEYYAQAESEFLAAAEEYNRKHTQDVSLYKGLTDHVWIEENGIELEIGRRVRLKSTEFFPRLGYRESRITRITRNVNLPSQMDLEIGDALGIGTLNKIGDVINDVKSYVGSMLGSLNVPDLIRSWDTTKPTDSNIYSARRTHREFLSKKGDDTAQGFIRFIKGLQVGERFVPGLMGEGGVFRKEADGTTYIEADNLYIRMKAYFDTVEIRKFLHTGGNRIATVAGAKCVRVEWRDSSNNVLVQEQSNLSRAVKFRCFFRANDGDNIVTNDFLVGDQAYCHVTRMQSETMEQASEGTGGPMLTTRHYWRLVIGTNVSDDGGRLTEDGEYWIDLSNYFYNGQPANMTWQAEGVTHNHLSHQAGSDIPMAQDDIVQLGHAYDTTRQGAIVEFVTGGDSPSYQIFQGIDEFSFVGKNYISLGYATGSTNTHGAGHAYMDLYGDVFIGAKPDAVTGESPTYIKYDSENEELRIKAVVEFQSPDDPTSITTLEQFANTVITDIDNIQSQIDGELDTWYYAGIPTLNNLPASQWTTDDLKKMHVGDLYYDKDSGFVYRFIYDTSVTPNVYTWVQIHDDAISEALKQAEKAQDTADHKRRVIVTQPPSTSHPDGNYVEYDVGDLWANATGTFTYVEEGQTKTVTYNNDLLRCGVSKPIRNASGVVVDGTFSITDWELATRYTDDTKIDAFLDGYQGNLTVIRNQIDQKAETYYEDNDPSTNQWGSEHVGDMWFCTSDHADPSMFKKGTTWVWQEYTNQTTGVVTYAWAEAQIPQVVFDTLDRKKAIYVAWNAWITTDTFGVQHNNLQLRDLFIPSEDTTGGGVQYKANRVYRCVSLNPTTFQEIDYVDNQDWSNWIQNTYNQNISNIESQIDKKAETWYQNVDPSTTASPNGWYGEDNAEHVGDLWLVNIDVTGSNIYKAGTTWYFKDNGDGASPRYTWEKQVVPQEVFDYADGKAAIFVGNPPSTYNINDMWFIGDGVSSSQLPTGCVAGDVVVSSAKRTGVYNKADWTKKDRYTDDTKFNTYISQIINGTSDQSDSAVVAQALHAIKAALNENTTISGGLILTSLISLKSNSQVWAGISGLYDANETGGGIAAWYGGGRVDHEAYPSSSDYAKSLFRFDGSGYVAGGNITWNANGAVTIKNITTLSDSQNTSLLNELATFNSAFTFTTSGSGSTTVLSITPNVPFTALTILDTSVTPNVGRPVATQKWVADNYVPLAFFNALFTAFSDSAGTSAIDPKTWTAQTAINNLKIMVGAWTNQYLSAYGFNSTSGGGGMSESAMWSALGSSTGTYGSSQINASHLTTALSGYATESWVSNRGYVLQVIEQNEQYPYPKVSGIVTLPASWKKSELSLKNITTVTNLGWVSTTEDGKKVVTSNTLAFWNGLYNGDISPTETKSNLAYCRLGQFGALAVKDSITFDYISTVSLNNVSNGDVLKFDAATNKWVNGQVGSTYTLPLAASGTRGGVRIGYTTDAKNRNYAVQLSSEKMYVNVPWANDDTKTTAGNMDINGATAAFAIYLVGTQTYSGASGSYATTFNNHACYIGTDNCLYSNGSKVLTVATGAPTSSFLIVDNTLSYGRNGLQYAQFVGNQGTSPHLLQNPNDDWWSHLILHHANKEGFYWDLAFHFWSKSIYCRIVAVGASTGWSYLLTSENYSTLCLPLSGGVLTGAVAIDTSVTYPLTLRGSLDTNYNYEYTVINFRDRLQNAAVADIGWLADNRGNIAYMANLSSTGVVSCDNYGAYYANETATIRKYTIFHTGNLKNVSQLTNDAGYLTSDNAVTIGTAQTINGAKTFTGTLSVNSKFNAVLGAKFQSLCIECNSDGSPNGRTGEINHYTGDLHLQYDSTSYGITMFNKLRFWAASGNTYLTSNGAYFTLKVGSAAHALIDYAWVVTSDMRRKDVIMNAGASIEQIADAPIFYYRLKGSPETTLTLGSSAQYWQQVFPNAISQTPDGFLSMDYSSIALASAVITARKVKNHEDRIRDLENENRELREEIRLLKTA